MTWSKSVGAVPWNALEGTFGRPGPADVGGMRDGPKGASILSQYSCSFALGKHAAHEGTLTIWLHLDDLNNPQVDENKMTSICISFLLKLGCCR